jgi:hypothetical protein
VAVEVSDPDPDPDPPAPEPELGVGSTGKVIVTVVRVGPQWSQTVTDVVQLGGGGAGAPVVMGPVPPVIVAVAVGPFPGQ